MTKTDVAFCIAEQRHLVEIVRLLADDQLGSTREHAGETLHGNYLKAFEAISTDENSELVVAIRSSSVVGTLQITYSPNLTHLGAWRATIEGVRVATACRQSGLGKQMITWSIERSRARGCRLVQLTTDLQRDDAMALYTKLGFVHSHAGMKMWIDK